MSTVSGVTCATAPTSRDWMNVAQYDEEEDDSLSFHPVWLTFRSSETEASFADFYLMESYWHGRIYIGLLTVVSVFTFLFYFVTESAKPFVIVFLATLAYNVVVLVMLFRRAWKRQWEGLVMGALLLHWPTFGLATFFVGERMLFRFCWLLSCSMICAVLARPRFRHGVAVLLFVPELLLAACSAATGDVQMPLFMVVLLLPVLLTYNIERTWRLAFRFGRLREAANARMQARRVRTESILLHMYPRHLLVLMARVEDPRTCCLNDFVTPYDHLGVLVADVVNFTSMADSMDPAVVLRCLNALYSHVDDMCALCGAQKAMTVGDAYVAVAHGPSTRGATAPLWELAASLLRTAPEKDEAGWTVRLRIGLAHGSGCGMLLGGDLGPLRYEYFGEPMKAAHTLEGSGLPMHVHTTLEVYRANEADAATLEFVERRELGTPAARTHVATVLLRAPPLSASPRPVPAAPAYEPIADPSRVVATLEHLMRAARPPSTPSTTSKMVRVRSPSAASSCRATPPSYSLTTHLTFQDPAMEQLYRRFLCVNGGVFGANLVVSCVFYGVMPLEHVALLHGGTMQANYAVLAVLILVALALPPLAIHLPSSSRPAAVGTALCATLFVGMLACTFNSGAPTDVRELFGLSFVLYTTCVQFLSVFPVWGRMVHTTATLVVFYCLQFVDRDKFPWNADGLGLFACLVVSGVFFDLAARDFFRQVHTIRDELCAEADRFAVCERLVKDAVPTVVALRLLQTGEDGISVMDERDQVACMFVEFSDLEAQCVSAGRPDIAAVNAAFSAIDTLIAGARATRIKAYGDRVLVTAGIPDYQRRPCALLARLALTMQDTCEARGLCIRIGLNAGHIVGGVLGNTLYLYDVFGDTVNVAARMLAVAPGGEVCVGPAAVRLIAAEFSFRPLPKQTIKGKGEMQPHLLVRPDEF